VTFRKLFDMGGYESFRQDVPSLTNGALAAKYGISEASVIWLKSSIRGASQPAGNPEVPEEDSEAYDVTISIPIRCLDDFLETTGIEELRIACFDLDSQGKAQLVQSILQARVSNSLPSADVGIPVIADQGEAHAETTT
jgi:hypothetical protein